MGEKRKLSKNFEIIKRQQSFHEIKDENRFDLVYFDAFGARVQPDLWTVELFALMFKAMKINGILVTYSAKGSVRRALQTVGFDVERLAGPPGKREMLRATKINCLGKAYEVFKGNYFNHFEVRLWELNAWILLCKQR